MVQAVHIPGGPQVRVANKDKRKARLEAKQSQAVMAKELTQSVAWSWFVQQCEARASVFERQVLDRTRVLDPREEDRLRGEADAYRRMPRIVEEAAAAYDRALKQQSKEQQS